MVSSSSQLNSGVSARSANQASNTTTVVFSSGGTATGIAYGGGGTAGNNTSITVAGSANTASAGVNTTTRSVSNSVPAPISGGTSLHGLNYSDLTATLVELKSSLEDDWKIESEVFSNSLQVAAALFDQNIPSPQIFSHGSKSVVFNWENENFCLNLTIGKARLWASTSSHHSVSTRVELTSSNKNYTGQFLGALKQTFALPMPSASKRKW